MRHNYQLHRRKWNPHPQQRRSKRFIKEASKHQGTWSNGTHAEYLKYGSNQLFVKISETLSKTSQTGEYSEGIFLGTLNALPTPPNKKEKVNVRPIILLLPLRKKVTISLIDTFWVRMKNDIPLPQVAYQSGRSTTE